MVDAQAQHRHAFVTGATGFIGHNLVARLLDEGWRVTALHRAGSDTRQLRDWGVHCVAGEITDARSLEGCIPADATVVFHLAGSTSLWSRLRAEQLRVNVRGTRNVVRAALKAGVPRFVHLSSLVAFGLHGGTITEDTPSRGLSSTVNYVRSKALAEREIRRGIAQGLRAVIVNPGHALGPYDTHNWSRLFKLIRQRRVPGIPPGGGSFCHSGEVARALIAAAERGRVGEHYLLGGVQLSYAELVARMAEFQGLKRPLLPIPLRALRAYAALEEWTALLFRREPDITREAIDLLSGNLYCDSRKAQRELGYAPAPLERLLADSYGWLVSAGMAPPLDS